MENITNFPHQITKPPKQHEDEVEEEEDDDTASLSDFPLSSSSQLDKKPRRSSSEPSDFFEFFNNVTSDFEMSNAEDIIFCGKLIPYKQNPSQILKSHSADHATHRRYSDSLPEFNSARPTRKEKYSLPEFNSARPKRNKKFIMKTEAADIHRSFSKSSSAKSEGSKILKPKWFVLMFGPLKLHKGMDLRDMKNRQVRRKTGRLFAGGESPVRRRSFWGHDWLRVLSCKSHASVAVNASIGLVPHF